MEEARSAYETGLRVLKLPLPQSSLLLALRMAQQIVVQLAHSTRRGRGLGAREAARFRRQRSHPQGGASARSLDADLLLPRRQGAASLLDVACDQPRRKILRALAGTGRELREPWRNLRGRSRYADARSTISAAQRLSEQLDMPTVSANVNLLSGLYETSVGEWQTAKSLFEPGLEQALRLGDTRRWSELAGCLETIISPWLLNPSYGGKHGLERTRR